MPAPVAAAMRKRSRCPWTPPGEKRANDDDPDGVAGVGAGGLGVGAGGVGVGAAVKQQTLSEPPLHAPVTVEVLQEEGVPQMPALPLRQG